MTTREPYGGTTWLRNVKDWPMVAIRYLLEEKITDGPHETPEFIDEGVPFLSVDGIQDGELTFQNCRFVSEEQHREFRKKAAPRVGDILFGKAASTGKIARVKTDTEFSIWSPLALLRPNQNKSLPAYFEYALKSLMAQAQVDILITTNTQNNISMDAIPRIRIPVPSLPEQQQISNFLDNETTRIDGLIVAKERVLELLAEKRRALITHAVTRGLDPTAPLRDSGIPWLGEIPAHWQIAGFTKYLRSLVDYRGKTPEKTDSGVFLVTARNIRNGYIDYEASQEYIEPDVYEETMQRGKPHIGELLLTTEAPLGQAALVDREDIALAQRVIKLDYESKVVLNEFALQWILSALFQWQLNSYATGSTALGIKAERLHMLRNVIPPLDEQGAIVAHIAKETAKLDALREATERTIRLLKERRAALIAAAVTGKLDVNRAA